MEIIRLIFGILITISIGWCALRCILYNQKRPLFEEIALSYGLGMGLIALEFLLFWFINIKPTLFNILLPWIAIFLITVIASKRSPERSEGRSERSNLRERESLSEGDCFGASPCGEASHSRLAMTKSLSFFERFLIGGIALEAFLSFFRALIKPIESFDSIAIYAIRAKVFYAAGAIPRDFFSHITTAFPNSSHPLMIPLAETWAYTFMGSFNDFLVKAIFPLYFAAILVIFYFALREFFKRKNALIFTFILATIPQFNRFSSIGYADFVLAYYFTAAFLYIFHWLGKRKIQYLILSAVFMGLACWTKTEGYALFLAAALALLLFAAVNFKKNKNLLLKLGVFSFIVLLIAGPWILLTSTMQLENEIFKLKSFGVSRFASSFLNFDRCPRIIYEYQKQFFGPKKWNIIWIIFLALFALNIKTVFKGDIRYVTLLLILIMMGYAYVYLLMPLKEGEPINIYISTNLSRLFIHFTPLAVFWLARLCKEKRYV